MARIVPSQVVATIDRAFPGAWNAGNELTLSSDHVPAVAAVFAQIRAIPDELVAILPSDEHAMFLSATAAIEASLRAWETPAHRGLQLSLANLGQLDRRNPIHIIRAALEKCPDSAAGVRAGLLAFLDDPALAQGLEIDIATSESALANGEYKAAAVLAGSVSEALLLWAITRYKPDEIKRASDRWVSADASRKPLASNPELWGLGTYIGVALELKVIRSDTASALELTQQYRNLIHPGRAIRLGLENTRATATIAVGAMLRLVENLAKR